MQMDVYAVSRGWFRAEAKCLPCITKLQVISFGRTFAKCEPVHRGGEAIKVPIDKCYTSVEQAQGALQELVHTTIAMLNTRIEELRSEPKYEESYVYESIP
jgi:hypothetical protein